MPSDSKRHNNHKLKHKTLDWNTRKTSLLFFKGGQTIGLPSKRYSKLKDILKIFKTQLKTILSILFRLTLLWPCQSSDIHNDVPSQNPKNSVILWYFGCLTPTCLSKPFHFMPSTFLPPAKFTLNYCIIFDCFLPPAFTFMSKTLPEWLLSPTPTALNFIIIPTGLKLLFQEWVPSANQKYPITS